LVPQYLTSSAPLLNAGSVSNTLGYASDPDLAVNYSHSYLTWRDDGVRSAEGGRASIFILGRERDVDIAAPYVLKENRLFDATEQGVSVSGGEVQTIGTSLPEYGYGVASPVVVWTEARARSQLISSDAPTSGIYLRVDLAGLALADDSWSGSKTAAVRNNLLGNDSNLFGEIMARVTQLDGRDLPYFGEDHDFIEFQSPRGAKIRVFPDGRIHYDPRGVAEFTRLRAGESITESFVYQVSNFLHQAEAIVQFIIQGGTRWHNSALPVDVRNDGAISPLDALVVINFLNMYGSHALDDEVDGDRSQFSLDVNNDGSVTPLDALLVINWLNLQGPDGEGEEFTGDDDMNSDWPAGFMAWEDDLGEAVRRRRRDLWSGRFGLGNA
jgi:hypothetical protein